MPAKLRELGDYAHGRVVNSEMHLTRPARTVSGRIVGVYPHDPKHVDVQTGTGSGNVVTIRIAGR